MRTCEDCQRLFKPRYARLCDHCYVRRWQKRNPGKHAQYVRTHNQKTGYADAKRYAAAHPEKARARSNKYSERNREKRREAVRRWRLAHPESNAHHVAMRRARILRATPEWADIDAIRDFYLRRPRGMTVDHVLPLQGASICGLHVAVNLQYLSAAENCRKKNRLVEPLLGMGADR